MAQQQQTATAAGKKKALSGTWLARLSPSERLAKVVDEVVLDPTRLDRFKITQSTREGKKVFVLCSTVEFVSERGSLPVHAYMCIPASISLYNNGRPNASFNANVSCKQVFRDAWGLAQHVCVRHASDSFDTLQKAEAACAQRRNTNASGPRPVSRSPSVGATQSHRNISHPPKRSKRPRPMSTPPPDVFKISKITGQSTSPHPPLRQRLSMSAISGSQIVPPELGEAARGSGGRPPLRQQLSMSAVSGFHIPPLPHLARPLALELARHLEYHGNPAESVAASCTDGIDS